MKNSENPDANILTVPIEVRAEMAMKDASEKLVREHLRDGSPIYIWRDGKVVAAPPQELQHLLFNLSAE